MARFEQRPSVSSMRNNIKLSKDFYPAAKHNNNNNTLDLYSTFQGPKTPAIFNNINKEYLHI